MCAWQSMIAGKVPFAGAAAARPTDATPLEAKNCRRDSFIDRILVELHVRCDVFTAKGVIEMRCSHRRRTSTRDGTSDRDRGYSRTLFHSVRFPVRACRGLPAIRRRI